MATATNPSSRRQLGELAPRYMRLAAAVGVGGLAASVVIAWLAPGLGAEEFFRSYLVGFLFILSLALGGLFFTLIQHLTRAGWGVTVRRLAEGVGANLAWMWVLFLPILGLVLFGRGAILYDWLDVDHLDDILRGKQPYLNKTFWLVRAVLFLAIWAVVAGYYYRNSVAQDRTGDVTLTHRMQRWAPIAMILYAVTQTLAIIDWVMSLEAHWFSTMFGVYFFAATCCGFFASLILLMYVVQRWGCVREEITLEHYQDVGKLLFGFGVVFWAYIAFSQYMLIWYANIPEETGWYLARQLGAWKWVSALLLIGHFAIPFVLLVTKHTKRIKPVIAVIAGWLLLMHFVDLYWLVMPHVPGAEMAAASSIRELQEGVVAGDIEIGFHPSLLDLTCLVGMVGLLVAGTLYKLRECELIPIQDPRLHESLAFENM